MGTNYYLYPAVPEPCPCCKRPYEAQERHIGKGSGGWCFALHVYPEEGINTLEDWQRLWQQPGFTIKNEYGDVVSPSEMLENVAERSYCGEPSLASKPRDIQQAWLKANHAALGPNGLVRSRIDGNHCIGHGPGTWDLCIGEYC